MDNQTKGKKDEIKGRVKQAAGDLTGRDDLKREGKVDEASGKIRQKADELAEKASDAVERAADAVNRKAGDRR